MRRGALLTARLVGNAQSLSPLTVVRAGAGGLGAGLRAGRAAAPARAASFGLDADYGKDVVVFPRERLGKDYDLNWSLAEDGVVPGGDATRNAPLRALLGAASGKVTNKTLTSDFPGSVAEAGVFSTDDVGDRAIMDIDEFDARLEGLTDRLHELDNLYVEDLAIGSHREAELRVRVISDSSEYALFLRNLLVRVPERNAQTAARPIVVYIGARTGDGSGESYTVSDWDDETGRASIVVSGAVPVDQVLEQITHVASRLYNVEEGVATIQSKRGGGFRMNKARDQGRLDLPDAHYTALPNGAAADPLLLRNASTLLGNKSSALVVGASGAALANAAATNSLFAAHASVWGSLGVSGFFSGAVLPAKSVKGDLPAGALVTGGVAAIDVDGGAALAAHPKTIVVVQKKQSDSPDLAKAMSLSEAEAERLEARIKQHGTKVVTVTKEADIAKALK